MFRLRQIPDDLLLLPSMAVCCTLYQAEHLMKSADLNGVRQQMENLLLGHTFVAVVKVVYSQLCVFNFDLCLLNQLYSEIIKYNL